MPDSTSPRTDLSAERAKRPLQKNILDGLRNAARLVWIWSVPYRNSHRPDDQVYVSVWKTKVDPDSIRQVFHTAYPEVPWELLPEEEEHARCFLRHHFLSTSKDAETTNARQAEGTEKNPSPGLDGEQLHCTKETSEEIWENIPTSVSHCLAAANAANLERKLQLLTEEHYHPTAGLGSITRSLSDVSKTFRMWRQGFRAATSLRERVFVNVFFLVLAFSAVYPDVAAGFLGERSYNQRSIGSRIMTLIQLFFLWTFPFHSLWLLYNWSLERLLGAFVGNFTYALVAISPAIRASYKSTWFRTMLLVMSMCWQVSVQFSPTIRDTVVRLLTRRQMSALRDKVKLGDGIDWSLTDKAIHSELVSRKAFVETRAPYGAIPPSWDEVPIKVRVERYIQFTDMFVLGRSADQLISLLKLDLERVIDTYDDYMSTISSNGPVTGTKDAGHIEPRLPKFILVFLSASIFAYVCFSFWTQPFTFNTVVAYSTVVVIKQTVVALKRYQTVKSARRLFTNMVSINILGVLLVSTPVIIDRHVLENDANMVALTLAMVFATLFLVEPIAPALLTLTEKSLVAFARLRAKIRFPRL
ncbi:hypothetical protein QQS21_000336 [Conoideocrella luteorostrata]|uniref:Uncharacterized protein n=1 Tax=Conoideocrella luteorostrata TaxID=1105319 RepID=A0AAJ0D1U5_9HYPO|nr:hypothetical protein QQS21_000336 [Conoideocrella luteorostrata]